MIVFINGKGQETERAFLKDILEDLNLSGVNCVVEVDGVIVPREDHAAYPLTEETAIEIVRFVGGG